MKALLRIIQHKDAQEISLHHYLTLLKKEKCLFIVLMFTSSKWISVSSKSNTKVYIGFLVFDGS